jgi:cAMP phosphodiesterase
LPFATKEANAAFITRNLVDTYLITHPHLDHISGFVVNTASLQGNRPKRLAGLPGTIDAFKNHVFNVSLELRRLVAVLCLQVWICDKLLISTYRM